MLPNDTDMLAEIIRELTKIQENTEVTSEKVLHWAKRVEAQRAQSAIMNSLTETKEFDKLKIIKTMYKDSARRPSVYIKNLQNRHVDIVDPAIHQDNIWAMERNVQIAAKSATSEECVRGEPKS